MRQYSENGLSYPDDMLSIIRNGLKRTKESKKVLIVGGGMSGLVSASLLKRAGHQVSILEANNRIGGRVHTLRKPFKPGNYLEAGAMRIPSNHQLVMEYIERFGLPINSFVNTSPKDLIYANNVLTTRGYYEKNPDVLQFPVKESEKGKTARELFLQATQPFIDLYYNSPPPQRKEIRNKYAQYSMREFLKFNPFGISVSDSAIRCMAVLLGLEGFPEYSFVDILTDITYPIFSEYIELVEVTGGNDSLPWAFYPELKNNLYFHHKVERVFQYQNGVSVQTIHPITGYRNSFEADYVIVTIPFPLFQFVDVFPYESISFDKYEIIRELNTINAVKIGIEFKSRFWEAVGMGNAVTNQPTRYSYIPSHGVGSSSSAVLLASYTWGHDSELWTSQPFMEKVREALTDLSKIYGDIVYKDYIRTVSYDWGLNPFAAGAFTLFLPGQGEEFREVMRKPEGRLHFAGEHASSFHGWIEGAVESGIRAAYEINARE